jgi:unsaturated rhamnogalacturonyl hydrolase
MSQLESSTNTRSTEALTPIQWAEKACETLMAKFEPELLPPERFHYHQGVFLSGMEKVWRLTQKDPYHEYIKRWVDSHILADGSVPKCKTNELDDIQPGVLLFNLYEQTGDERIRKPCTILYHC